MHLKNLKAKLLMFFSGFLAVFGFLPCHGACLGCGACLFIPLIGFTIAYSRRLRKLFGGILRGRG